MVAANCHTNVTFKLCLPNVLNPTFPSATMEQAPLFCCHDCKSSKTMDQFELHKRKNNTMFVASWTTPPLPDLPPPPWPPPHFHGHVFKAFSILQGQYHVSFNKECAEIFKRPAQQVDLAGPHIDYRTKPSVHLQCTDITCVCGPTHGPHAFLQFLTQSDNGIWRTEHTPVHKTFFTSYNIS